MRSIFYRSPLLYDALMLALYRRAFGRRLACVAALVPEGSSVLEVCCGPARLYGYLARRAVTYAGLDASPEFVRAAQRRHLDVRLGDLRAAVLGARSHDVVIMQASLYQFHPSCAEVVDQLRDTARQQVIICEPVANLASSTNPVLSMVARRLTSAGENEGHFRFDAASLAAFMDRYRDHVLSSGHIDGGREMYYVLRARGRE
jgi:trans-aconitate methyltransferase